MGARRRVALAEPDAREQGPRIEACGVQRAEEQPVLLEAEAAALAGDELVEHRIRIEADAAAQDHVQILERDGEPVRALERGETLRIGLGREGEARAAYDAEMLQVGENNTVHAFAYTPAGAPLNVEQWTVSAQLTGAGLEPVSAPLLGLIPRNHAAGAVTFPQAGTYRVRFTLRIGQLDQDTVTTSITVPQPPESR